MKYRLGGLFAICWCALLLAGPAAAQSIELKALNEQVTTLYQQGKYDQALDVAKMALEIGQHDLGPDHPGVADALSNLAAVYQALGQNAAAEPLLERALAIRKKNSGLDRPAATTANLNPKSSAAVPASAKTNVPAAPAAAQNPPPAAAPCVRGAPGKVPKYNDLITAVMLQDEGAVRELLDFGKWINVQSESGFTPVIVAAKLDDLRIAQLLLACGADPNHRNQLHLSALDYARQNHSDRMVSLLRNYGARDE